MPRADPAELLTPDESARVDALSPVPVSTLMENAGRAVARAVRARFTPCRTLVLCGPGNNGGDGYVAARLLAEQGWPVTVAALAPPRGGSPAAKAAGRWNGPTAPFSPTSAARAALVVDAVFGAGLARDLDPAISDTLKATECLVAVDVPSGVDGATGAVRGYAPQAAVTVTFVRRKPGHLLLPGRDLCGETVLADIGLPDAVVASVASNTFANGPTLWTLPQPAAAGHKYSRGTVTVLGGASMTGAARMAADAARRIGAGMVFIVVPPGGARCLSRCVAGDDHPGVTAGGGSKRPASCGLGLRTGTGGRCGSACLSNAAGGRAADRGRRRYVYRVCRRA